jgi:chorismate-pyruvate lyase
VSSRRELSELTELVGLFYSSAGELGHFERVLAEGMPKLYRGLLNHDQHMTVAMESFYGESVDVQVKKAKTSGEQYARKILLTRRSDRRVVQFGIVRLNFAFLGAEVRREIESQSTPLGRILIRHNVMREIELLDLWRVTPGPDLCRLLGTSTQKTTYGRTAIIHCNGDAAVELLEIAAPVEENERVKR